MMFGRCDTKLQTVAVTNCGSGLAMVVLWKVERVFARKKRHLHCRQGEMDLNGARSFGRNHRNHCQEIPGESAVDQKKGMYPY